MSPAAKEQMTTRRISKLCNCEPAAAKEHVAAESAKLCNCEPAAAEEQMMSHRISVSGFGKMPEN